VNGEFKERRFTEQENSENAKYLRCYLDLTPLKPVSIVNQKIDMKNMFPANRENIKQAIIQDSGLLTIVFDTRFSKTALIEALQVLLPKFPETIEKDIRITHIFSAYLIKHGKSETAYTMTADDPKLADLKMPLESIKKSVTRGLKALGYNGLRGLKGALGIRT